MNFFPVATAFLGVLVVILAIMLRVARGNARAMKEAHTLLEEKYSALEGESRDLKEIVRNLEKELDIERLNDAIATETGTHSIAGLLTELNQSHEQMRILEKEIDGLKRSQRLAEDRSTRDALTGLLTRSGFDELFFVEALNRKRDSFPAPTKSVAVVYIDLDGFKQYNDSQGHAGGDRVLQAFAELTRECFPRKTDLISRRGGDEFVVALFDATATDALVRSQTLLETMRHDGRFQLIEGQACVTASIGIVDGQIDQYADMAQTVDDLIQKADRAMYRAKQAGKNIALVSGESKAQRGLDIDLNRPL